MEKLTPKPERSGEIGGVGGLGLPANMWISGKKINEGKLERSLLREESELKLGETAEAVQDV